MSQSSTLEKKQKVVRPDCCSGPVAGVSYIPEGAVTLGEPQFSYLQNGIILSLRVILALVFSNS